MNWRHYSPILLLNSFACSKPSEYTETVSVTHLPNQNILLDIVFKLSHKFPDYDALVKDLGLLPNLIYTLPKEFGLIQGKIAFTRGIWDSSMWSKAPNHPTSSGFQFNGQFKENYQNLP